MFDRKDYEELKEKKKKNGHDPRWGLEYLAQAEVHQKNLTGQPEWDRFLSYLQATRTRLIGNEESLKSMLFSPQMVDQNEIMMTKTAIARTSGMIEMLDAVLALPKDIMESGEKAKKKLEQL